MSVAGPLVSAHEIEEAVIASLRKRLPAYLVDVCSQYGVGKIQAIKSWSVMTEYDRWPEAGLPALVVAASGLRDTPQKGGDGFYRATWNIEVSVTIGGAKAAAVRKHAQIYAAAVRGALLQERSLGDELTLADWIDEAYGLVPTDKRRTIVAAANVFTVEHERTVSWRLGPAGDPPIPAEWPTVEETEVETEITE